MLSRLTRRQKRAILLAKDVLLVPIAMYLAFAFRYGTIFPREPLQQSIETVIIVIVLSPFVFVGMRLPWIKLSTMDARGALRIMVASATLGLVASAASVVLDVGSPRSVPSIFSVTFFTLSFVGRIVALKLLQLGSSALNATPVAVFGAGAAGIQLASALRQSREVRPVFFVDDNPSFKGLLVADMLVLSRQELAKQVAKGKVERILIAIPSLTQAKLGQLVSDLSELGVEIQVLPSYVDLISGQSKQLRAVSADALLGRDKVDLDVPEIERSYAGKVVMVTGAGGSIGSELCQQLLDCRASKIVLYEQSEFALYDVNSKLLEPAQSQGMELVARLGSVCDQTRLEQVMRAEQVQIILHAAAYKHVPLVEDNEIEGARNNILGTLTVAQTAKALGVERFILISTDKAVRPTNVMGATKRLAELVVQDLAQSSVTTCFSMVRFGNVLGSSGSVIPLFQQQIRLGGPVTVTHSEVTRFFMTIPEASRLVLLAGAFSEGGEVFVLDMGQPVKIIELARRMIEMSGAQVKSAQSPDGIEIKVTGLRPGEKLYEELLIDSDSLVPTPHEKILKAQEKRISEKEIEVMLGQLHQAIVKYDTEDVRNIIKNYVDGYVEVRHS